MRYRTLLSDLLGGSKEDAEKQVEEEKKRRRLVALVTGSTDDNAGQERTENAHMSSASEYSSRGMWISGPRDLNINPIFS